MAFCLPDTDRGDSLSSGQASSETEASYTAGLIRQAADTNRATAISERRGRAFRARIGEANRLLEVGAGVGLFQSGFELAGFAYTGIDVDLRLVDTARGLGRAVACEDFSSFEPGQLFDVVAASQVFEHFTEPHEFLRQAERLLRPGGLLHLDIPNHHGLAGLPSRMTRFGRGHRLGALEPPHHLMGYSPSTLRVALSGWDAVEVFQADAADATWGQAGRIGTAASVYGRLSRLTKSEGILVALARRPELPNQQ